MPRRSEVSQAYRLPFARERERWVTCDPGHRVRCAAYQSVHRGVAQLGSALALGARGRGFKSRHPDQVNGAWDDLALLLAAVSDSNVHHP